MRIPDKNAANLRARQTCAGRSYAGRLNATGYRERLCPLSQSDFLEHGLCGRP